MPAVSSEEYRKRLAQSLGLPDHSMDLTLEELEQALLATGRPLPIVRLPEHFHYRDELFPHVSKTPVPKCRCTAQWPCPLGEENAEPIPTGEQPDSGAETRPIPH